MKKETAKWVVQILISILTAIATALGATSCIKKAPHPPKGECVDTLTYTWDEPTTEALSYIFEDTTAYQLENPEDYGLYVE